MPIVSVVIMTLIGVLNKSQGWAGYTAAVMEQFNGNSEELNEEISAMISVSIRYLLAP